MPLASKLLLTIITTLAALALASTSASAENGIEVSAEGTSIHCTTGDPQGLCQTSAHSEEPKVIRAHLLSGPEVSTSICDSELHAVVESEDGEGYIDQQVISGAGCPNKPCGATNQGTADGAPWPIHMHETEGPLSNHEFGMDILFCLSPNQPEPQPQRFCHIEVGISEEPMTHQYEFEAEGPDGDGIPCTGPESTPPPAGVRVLEVDGHWISEDENIEAAHVE